MNNQTHYADLFYSCYVQDIAKLICELAAECWSLGLSDSTGFSISQIIPDTKIVITDKSGTAFRRNKIAPEDLILIDLNGDLIYQPSGSGNARLAPVNVVVHLAGYNACPAQGCIHWHDPYTIAFASNGLDIPPFTLQSKLIGNVPCIMVDDRMEKQEWKSSDKQLVVPSGLYARPDVYYVMKKTGEVAAQVLAARKTEFEKHGIVVTHFEHGLFSWGRSLGEAFDNGYRSYRNAKSQIYAQLLKK